MNLKIRVTFARRSALAEDLADQLQLSWILNKTPVALKYFKALKIACAEQYMYRRDRFYSFPNCYYTETRVVERLNQSIEAINRAHPGLIPTSAKQGMSQDEMNHLHTYFEKYRGALLNPSDIYANAPNEIREAFDELNLMIHRYEDAGFSLRQKGTGYAKFYATFGLSDKIQRYPLEDEDYHHFTFKQNFGTWIVNYCEVGKPLQDIWRDGDSDIGHEAILPLSYYSADGMVMLSGPVSEEHHKKNLQDFYLWWDQNADRLRELGFKKEDPRNAVGHLPVAELEREHPVIAGRSDKEIVALVSNYQWISRVECVEDLKPWT